MQQKLLFPAYLPLPLKLDQTFISLHCPLPSFLPSFCYMGVVVRDTDSQQRENRSFALHCSVQLYDIYSHQKQAARKAPWIPQSCNTASAQKSHRNCPEQNTLPTDHQIPLLSSLPPKLPRKANPLLEPWTVLPLPKPTSYLMLKCKWRASCPARKMTHSSWPNCASRAHLWWHSQRQVNKSCSVVLLGETNPWAIPAITAKKIVPQCIWLVYSWGKEFNFCAGSLSLPMTLKSTGWGIVNLRGKLLKNISFSIKGTHIFPAV